VQEVYPEQRARTPVTSSGGRCATAVPIVIGPGAMPRLSQELRVKNPSVKREEKEGWER